MLCQSAGAGHDVKQNENLHGGSKDRNDMRGTEKLCPVEVCRKQIMERRHTDV